MNQNAASNIPEDTSPLLRHRKETVKKNAGYIRAIETNSPVDDDNLKREVPVFADDVEIEDINFSGDDDENDALRDLQKCTSLSVDSNCRVTSRKSLAANFPKADSCDTQFREGNVNFSAISNQKKRESSTDSEDMEISDEGKSNPNFLSIKCIDLNSFITATTLKQPQRGETERAKTESNASEGNCTDVEVVYSDDNDSGVTKMSTGRHEKKIEGKIPVSLVSQETSADGSGSLNKKVQKLVTSQRSSDDVQDEIYDDDDDDDVFLLENDSPYPIKQKVSDKSFFRIRQLFSNMLPNEASQDKKLQNMFKKNKSDSITCEVSENSTDCETLSDEENPLQANSSKGRSVRYKSAHFAVNSDYLTDEEELPVEECNAHLPKEWTETDELGSVRQVTQIRTETSIKLGGEGSCPELQKVEEKVCETSNKEKLPENDDEMLSFVEKRNFFQRLSLTSETIPTSSKWTQEVSLDDIPMAEGEIIKEQISFEERFKMFEPDEENMKKKTQKRDRAEQPTVYRYNFTKSSKDPPPVPPHPVVVSELEKAEQIVQQVNEELNAAECVVIDKETLDSDLTLEKVEQEVSSLLAEVDKEERALAATNCFHVDKVTKPVSLNLTSELKPGNGEDLDDKIHLEHCVVSDLNPETPETLLSITSKYCEDDKISPEENQQKAECIQFDSNADLFVQLMGDDHGPITVLQEEPSATVKSPLSQSSAYSSSLSQQFSNLPDEDLGVVAFVPESTAGDAYSESSKNVIDIHSSEVGEPFYMTPEISTSSLIKQEEEAIGSNEIVKYAKDSSIHDNQKLAIAGLDISTKLNQIKTQIFHEELDQSIEESPLEIKHINEELKKALGPDVQRETTVYQHIKTQIFSQELGEDIESGSPEKKVISPTVPEKDFVMMSKLSSSDLESDSVLVYKAEEDITLATVPQEEECIAMCTGSEQEIIPESPQAPKSESFSDEESVSFAEKMAVEHDDCLKEYEEAKAEHSLAEQLQTLASHMHFSSQQALDDAFPSASSDGHSSYTETGLPDSHRRSNYEVGYSRSNQKEMRSLKSTKQVSTIEELSSIESSDSPQELNQQDLLNLDVEIQKEDIIRHSAERDVREVLQTETERQFASEEFNEGKIVHFPENATEESLLETESKSAVSIEKPSIQLIHADDSIENTQDSMPIPIEETSFNVAKPDLLFGKMDEPNDISGKICPEGHRSESTSSDEDINTTDRSLNEGEGSKTSPHRVSETSNRLPSVLPKSDEIKRPKDAKDESDGETKVEDGGTKSSEVIAPHKKEESFSSSGDNTESPYYSAETSDYIRSPRSTPAASRPCSSEFEINVLSGIGSEYETCATSQDVSGEISGSYATAATSQETSYSTACSSLSHSSRESAYSVDSESSGHLASVEVSSEASETLVPSAQEMEMEFAPDVEMPILDEESSFAECYVKEPYDMDIPESVIRSGIELPFMKGWSLDDVSYDKNTELLTQQWSVPYESDHLGSFLEAQNDQGNATCLNSENGFSEHLTEEQITTPEIMSEILAGQEFPFVAVTSEQSELAHDMSGMESKSIIPGTETMLDNGIFESSSPNIDEEQLSMSESSVTHSEQTWQTSSVDTAFQISSAPLASAPSESYAVSVLTEGVADLADRQVSMEHAVCEEPPFSPDPQQSLGPSSYLQLNGPVEVEFNPEYDIPDDSYTADTPPFQPHLSSGTDLNVESESLVSDEVIQFEVEADVPLVNSQATLPDTMQTSSGCVPKTLETSKSDEDAFYSGISVEAEKPEAQQEQMLNYPDFEENMQPENLTYQDEATYLPESEQCDLRNLIDESSDSFQKRDQPVESTNTIAVVESPVTVQATDFPEKCDALDTSPEDERYDPSERGKHYKVFDANQYEAVLEYSMDALYDISVPGVTEENVSCEEEVAPDIFDNVACTDLYTHQEEEEEDFEIREAELVSSPVPSADDDKQSTPSFDTLSGRKFFKIGEYDDSAASSLQEFERLEAEIAAGRSSRGSGDSGERPVPSRNSEQDNISMNSLTEFEKLEGECVDGDHIVKTNVEEGCLLSEIDEGHESQASDGQETVSDDAHEQESDDSDDYEKRMSEIDEIIRMAQCNVEQFHEEGVDDLSDGVTLEEYSVSQKLLISSGNSTESSIVDQSPLPEKYGNSSKPSKLCGFSLPNNSFKHLADDVAHHDVCSQEDTDCKFDQSCSLVQHLSGEVHASESADGAEAEAWSEKKKLFGNLDESEFVNESLDADNGVNGPDSSSSGEKNGTKGGDCMVSSSDSIDPSSSTATHATYQFETDSVMSSSINSAQASGEECTMVSGTDTLEPEAVLTYTQGDIMNEEKGDGTLGTLTDRTFVKMSFPEASNILCELEASTESSRSAIHEELPKYDIEEKVKSFLKISNRTSDDPGDFAAGQRFCDPEKISKDILQALEKLDVGQQSGEVQFEKRGKNGKIMKVTQHVIEESGSVQHARAYSHEQMEMFLNKLTDEYQESHEPVILDFPQSAQFDQHIQSESYSSTVSVPKDCSDSAASLPLEISQPLQSPALGFSLSGDEQADGDVGHTTTTTTRIVTTVTTQDDEGQQVAVEEGGDELRHSMEVILNEFMSEDSPASKQSEQHPE